MKAVLLIGGLNRQFLPTMPDRPKSLIEIARKPLIEWQIEWLKGYRINSLVALAGRHGSEVAEYVGTGRKYGISASFIFEEEPLGTGGAIRNAFDLLKTEEMFFVLNGDVVTNIDLYKIKLSAGDVATMALVPLKTTYGLAAVNGSRITNVYDRPTLESYWLSAGIYLMSRRIFSYLPEKGSLEKSTFPKLAKEGKLGNFLTHESYWFSIDSQQDIASAADALGKKK
jgi:NDP-sugar pyrophosphorylase family protein